MMARDVTSMTIRLDSDLAAGLAIVAECDGEPVAETIRAAVAAWVNHRRADAAFQAALCRRIDQHRALLREEADRA